MSNWQSEGTIFGLPGGPRPQSSAPPSGNTARLSSYAKTLLESGAPAVLAGDFNVMPTDLDVYAGALGR
jgi:hypothetical protein